MDFQEPHGAPCLQWTVQLQCVLPRDRSSPGNIRADFRVAAQNAPAAQGRGGAWADGRPAELWRRAAVADARGVPGHEESERRPVCYRQRRHHHC